MENFGCIVRGLTTAATGNAEGGPVNRSGFIGQGGEQNAVVLG